MGARLNRAGAAFAAGLALAAFGAGKNAPATPPDGEAPTIDLELNGLEATGAGCRVAFVARNGLPHDIDRLAYEIALFDGRGLVERLLVLDFKSLAAAKTSIRRFDLAGVDCAAVGRILINDAAACEGDGIAAGDCITRLSPATRTTVTFGK